MQAHIKAVDLSLSKYFIRKYSHNTVNDQRVIRIDNLIMQSRLTYVVSYKYQKCSSEAVAPRARYIKYAREGLRDAIEVNTFKLQAPLMFIGSYSAILKAYYAKRHTENDRRINRILTYYKPKVAEKESGVHLGKKTVAADKRWTMRNTGTLRQIRKTDQPVLDYDALKNDDFTLIKLMQEFLTVKHRSAEKRLRFDIYARSKPKYQACQTERGSDGRIVKSGIEGFVFPKKLVKTSNPEIKPLHSGRAANKKISNAFSICNPSSYRSNRSGGALDPLKLLQEQKEYLARMELDNLLDTKGFFEISSIDRGDNAETSYLPLKVLNCPPTTKNGTLKRVRLSINKPTKVQKKTSIHNEFARSNPFFTSKEKDPFYSRGLPKGLNRADYKRSGSGLRKLMTSKSPLQEKDRRYKLDQMKPSKRTAKRLDDLMTQKVGVIKLPPDIFKVENKLKPGNSTLDKETGHPTQGFFSERTRSQRNVPMAYEGDLYTCYKPANILYNKSRDKPGRLDLNQTKKQQALNSDFKLSIFKFKR